MTQGPEKTMHGKRVGVLMGGLSSERDLSLLSGEAVFEALRGRGHDVVRIFVDNDLDVALRGERIDVAFLALHGRYGEDGCVQGLLEVLGIPYTGPSLLGAALATDKVKTKELLRLHNLPTPSAYVHRAGEGTVAAQHGNFGFPVVVKPRAEGSSLGVRCAADLEELAHAIEDATEYDQHVLVERHVSGCEVHVAVLGGHALGLAEVARIEGEMDAAMKQTGFVGTREAFRQMMRTDPRFFYKDAASLLTGYRDIAKRIDGALPKLFRLLPRLPYGVEPTPANEAKTAPTAYYQPGSPEDGRAGTFLANLYLPETRAKWEMEALTLHESVPGHHLQIALAQELPDVPRFRRELSFTAYTEGWGLYAESLGGDLGLYKDPYSKYGQLTYEMWRAVRLVVDTGLHSMHWTRKQAIDFFLAHAAKSQHDIEVEVDRYIVWPGQALAYKIGELEIKRLRAWSRQQLGDKFDVRSFHDAVLGAGALPLELVDRRVRAWVSAQQRLH